MDSGANSDGSSDEMSIPARIRPSIRRAVNNMEKYNKRRATDKYWSGFFVVIFISWIVSCQYVTRHQTEYSILSDNSSEPKNTSELVVYNNIIPGNITASINISEFLHKEIDNETKDENGCPVKRKKRKEDLSEVLSKLRRLLLDTLTFDLSRLVDIEEECNPVPMMHLLIGIMFLMLSFTYIYDNRMLCKQPVLIGATFFFVALLENLSAMFYARNSITFTLLSSHEKIASWTIPQTIFLIVCIMRKYAGDPSKKRDSDDDFRMPASTSYKCSITVGVPIFVMLHLLSFYTISILQQVVLGSALFYMIAGGSCYVGLTIYYYGAIVISCAIRVSNDLNKSPLTNLFRALFIVARYHFGTACYHATLIIPRIQATFIMNDPKLKALSIYPSYDRFFITHSDVHNFLTTFTGVNGSNYVKSLKELLRFWPNNVIKKEFHYNYGCLTIFMLIFLLTINSAILLLLWMYDLDDPQFSLATRAMYLKIIFMFFLAYPYFQATSDAHPFVYYRIWMRESGADYFTEMMLGHYFDEFDSSDDDDTDSIDSGVYNESIM